MSGRMPAPWSPNTKLFSPAVPIVSRTAIVNYTADQMFRLVTDIEAYPEFLPWCRSARARAGEEQDTTVATLEVARGPIRQSFTTCNRNTLAKSVQMQLVDGPFKYLEGCWQFKPLTGDGARVSLEIEFEFSNMLVRRAFGKVFADVTGELVDAFCRRAAAIYGRR